MSNILSIVGLLLTSASSRSGSRRMTSTSGNHRAIINRCDATTG